MIQPINFALIGAAGYIAPRHMKAIKDTGNSLVVALDPFDSVGTMDKFFPQADFFTEPERFDRYLDKLRRKGPGEQVDYVSICSPNYLHDAHIRLALRNGAHAICEKPIVLNPWNIDALQEIEKESGRKIFTILQLRHHPALIGLKNRIAEGPKDKVYDVDLTYLTSRGRWYFISWKGNIQKSGGVATNIGVHFFDMLSWIFGKVTDVQVTMSKPEKVSGYLELEHARVNWKLSLDVNDIPTDILEKRQFTYRSIKVEGEEIEFSDGFTDLHTLSYQKILAGEGYGLEAARNSIEIVHKIRNVKLLG
jgi:UDP-N-acetyl-2-amino-2-deoxyglucuronate dehydrogenase